MLSLLLKEDADIRERDRYGQAPLPHAAGWGVTSAIETLL